MILSNKEAEARLNSSGNLINRMKSKNNAMSLFGLNKVEEIKLVNPFEKINFLEKIKIDTPAAAPNPIPLQTTTLDNLIENHDSQVKLGLAHDSALDVLNRSTKMLGEKLDDIRADKLPSVIAAASKVVESIRRERSESSKNNKDKEVHYHYYMPAQKKISDYETVEGAVL